MAIAKKPASIKNIIVPKEEEAAQAFISGAIPKLEIAPVAEEDMAKKPVMIRFDPALLERVDAAAKHRGISRSAWVQFTLSRALDQGEG